MNALARGENRPAPADRMTVTVSCSTPVDVSALLLGTDGKVRADGDFVFFNQPVGPGVVYRHGRGAGDMVDVQTSALPADVDRVVVTASLDGSGPATFAAAGSLVATIASDAGTLTFPVSGLTTESAVVCVEIYRRGGGWKVRAVGQGYDNGLAGIATAFGVNVDDEPAPAPAPSAGPRTDQTMVAPSRTDPTVVAQPYPPAPAYPPAAPYPGGQPPTAHPHQPAPPYPPAPSYPPTPAYPAEPQPYSAPAQQPPTAHPVPSTFSSQQGALPMHSDLFDPRHAEVSGVGIQKQGGKMIKVAVNGEVMARAGSMVAYQGELQFQALGSGGIGRAIQQRLTGEGVPLMKVTGRGDLFLANSAADVHTIDLDGTDGLTINGANVLAFDSTLTYNIGRVQGAAGVASNAGLFNCVFTGRGRIAITSHGAPVVLNVDQPTYADPQAAVAWSSSLQTGIKRNDSFGLGRLMGRSTGEGTTLAFSGRGFVIVQPSELPPGGLLGGTGGGQEAGHSGGMFGGLLG
ncbi:AIM24 family protein [Nocardia cyriacigeorgica]|uniref:AIM24 family protein n=1 Tax=Nocardia cyriacigeorgica TaxID=135487 RepID=UPI001894B7FF|nr:AIM24 family protein [Nocardia cyriacigeorgica]MBF6454473.1 AIM24 family protein [Nocardia cyriacigeorgica]MBF6481483.1 AIM24 family protein [Nocardia cyriacigeorgica]MBF6552367.1 AIM24 family protein [Nocardia cyriacigeorgica]